MNFQFLFGQTNFAYVYLEIVMLTVYYYFFYFFLENWKILLDDKFNKIIAMA